MHGPMHGFGLRLESPDSLSKTSTGRPYFSKISPLFLHAFYLRLPGIHVFRFIQMLCHLVGILLERLEASCLDHPGLEMAGWH